MWLDVVIAFAAGGYLAWTGVKLIRESASGLMDEGDISLLNDLARVFEKHVTEGIIQIHNARIIRSGWFHHIDAHVVVPEFWSVEEAHQKIDQFEHAFVKDYNFEAEANFHLDPCKRKYCTVCDYPNCPVRQAAFIERMRVRLDDLRSPVEPAEIKP
jgi:divalent metal cation (Fe/Co/Zn/Cd) transporter